MLLIQLVLLAFAAAVSVYFYFYFRRSLMTFGIEVKSVAVKAGVAVAALGVGVASFQFPGISAIGVLHVLMVALPLELIHFVIKKFAGANGHCRWKKIYGSGIIPVVAAAAILTMGYFNMHHVVQTDYVVYTQKDISQEGYRVALLADVHYETSLDREELLEVCGRISEQMPDVVVLCGDIVDNSTSKAGMEEVFQILGTIRSKYGTFYVHGNHDRPMAQLESDYTTQDLIRAIEENGITILEDEVYPVTDDFVLAGRADRGYGAGGGRMSIDTLLDGADRNDFILTLDHQPREYAQNGAAGTDLLLSGHTHGGQIWPVNVLDHIFKFNEAVYGITRIDEDTHAVVTSGLAGWNWPIKTASAAEFVMIQIKKQ